MVALTSIEEFERHLPEVEYLLALRPPRRRWQPAARLRLVQMVGVGVDSVLPAPDLAPGVALANASGVAASALAEFALSLVLALEKGLPGAWTQQSEKVWRNWVPRRLEGQTVAILGLGTIGMELASRLARLGVEVIGTRRSAETRDGAVGVRVWGPEATAEVLERASIVVVLLPSTSATEGLLDAEMLDHMESGARLIHLARGGIVDEVEVAARLHDGRLGGAAFDVFATEPLPKDSPLWTAPGMLITPHNSGLFAEYGGDLVDLFSENIERLRAGSVVRNLVDRDRGY